MKRILLFCFFFPCFLYAQKQEAPDAVHPIDLRLARCSFATIYVGNSSEENLVAFLKEHNPNFANCEPQLLHRVESRGGSHLLFREVFQGVEVYRGDIKINTDQKGNIKSILDNSYSIREDAIGGNFPGQDLVQAHTSKIAGLKRAEQSKIYFPLENRFQRAVKVTLYRSDAAYYEEIMDGSGKVLYTHDLNSYYKPQLQAGPDSLVSASVFLPDPITSAGVTYGAPYADLLDADNAQLSGQLVNVNMRVYYGNDTFLLKSPYAIISQFSAPDTTPPAWFYQNPNFHFTRSVGKFEDVNAFYHISTFHSYIQSLGFNNIVNYQIKIDTHALNGQDNSIFSPANTPHELMFGEGGVDDAEDADVLIHEYGHAVSESAAPGTNTGGSQRQALDEAIGDYFASSYSRSINSYYWNNVFSWDGHNEFWPGRNTVSSKHYPENLMNNLYSDAEIWSATLMQVWGDIGRQAADANLIESIYGYASGMPMTSAAHLYIQADSTLFGGAHYSPICYRMSARGLWTCVNSVEEQVQNEQVRLLNGPYFGSNDPLVVYLPENGPTRVEMYDANGNCLSAENFDQKGNTSLRNVPVARGIYFLRVVSGSNCTGFKVVRL